MQSKITERHEGYDRIVYLDEEHAYVQPKTVAAFEKIQAEIMVLTAVNDRVDIDTPRYQRQEHGQFIFSRVSGNAFSNSLMKSQTKELIESNAHTVARFMSQLHQVPVATAGTPWEQNCMRVDLRNNLKHKNVVDYLKNRADRHKLIEAFETLERITPSSDHIGLLHGDLHGGNILVNPQTHVSGIVDFGESMIGDIHYEFRYAPGYGELFLELLIEKYESESGRRLNRDRLKLYFLLNAFCHLFYSVTNDFDIHFKGREGWVEHIVTEYSELSHDRCLVQ